MNDLRERTGQVKPLAAGVSSASRSLVGYAGKRIAVILACGGTARAFCGAASYEIDPDLGRILRIRLDGDPSSDGGTELFVSEKDWEGQIGNGESYGCDFCFTPSPLWPPG